MNVSKTVAQWTIMLQALDGGPELMKHEIFERGAKLITIMVSVLHNKATPSVWIDTAVRYAESRGLSIGFHFSKGRCIALRLVHDAGRVSLGGLLDESGEIALYIKE